MARMFRFIAALPLVPSHHVVGDRGKDQDLAIVALASLTVPCHFHSCFWFRPCAQCVFLAARKFNVCFEHLADFDLIKGLVLLCCLFWCFSPICEGNTLARLVRATGARSYMGTCQRDRRRQRSKRQNKLESLFSAKFWNLDTLASNPMQGENLVSSGFCEH